MLFMSTYMKKLMSLVTLIFLATVLNGCGGSNTTAPVVETPLWCKSPETINTAGDACELVITPCNYPEIANDQGLCVMDIGEWRPGANGINMPAPVYVAAPNEVVYYYQLSSADYTGWGIHAWNNPDCDSYADFDHPEGGTAWGVPILPTGIDPNFGAYWVMNLVDSPTCTNFIPYNFDAGIQTSDLSASFTSQVTNPTGSHTFYVLEGFEDTIYPFPRTFDSLVVPGGATLTCEAPLILNQAGDECITDPSIVPTFVPGESVLYLRGDFNGWIGDATDEALLKANNFNYVAETSTYIMATSLTAGTYGFKVADIDWSAATSFGATAGDENVVIGESKTLTVTDGQNITITVANDGNFQFSFNATDPENPVLTVTEVSLSKVMYVKGSMNGWANVSPMVYEGNNIYTSVYNLTAGDFEFKVADDDWTDATNFGASVSDVVQELDVPKTLVQGRDSAGDPLAQNITLSIPSDGSYRFTLDTTDAAAPILIVSSAIPFGSEVLSLRGSMNGWDGDAAGFKFAYADNHYTLVTTLTPNTDGAGATVAHEFKIAAAPAWDGTVIGAVSGDGDLVLDEARTLTTPGDNITFLVNAETKYKFDIDATDKSAPVLTVSEYIPPFAGRTIYLKGTMNSWTTDDAYILAPTDNIFTLTTTITAGSHEFKIASADWEDDSTIGALSGSTVVTVGQALTVATKVNGGADNLTLEVPTDTLYKFVIDASDQANVTLTVSEVIPFSGRTMYLKGSMNGWSNNDAYVLSYANNTFTLTTTIAAGSHEFKIASADWEDDSTIGALSGSNVVTVGQALTVATKTNGGADNLTLEVAADTMYKFVIDTSDLANITLTVSEAVPFSGRTMYLKGSMNGWSNDAAYVLSYANDTFTLITAISAGSHEFKIASADWEDDSTIGGFTGSTAVTVGTPLAVATKINGGADNLTLEVATDTLYKFVIDASDRANVTLTVSEEVPFAGRDIYLKGTMNGWSTDAAYLFTNVAGTYTLEATLTAGAQEFKIASDGWEDDSTIGAFDGSTVVTVDVPLEVAVKTKGGANNMTFEATAAIYIFTIDATSAGNNSLTISLKP
ncbi:MAG: hypothetical protein COB35_08550 [Gammaproteobacteria bacterium]|nr:MAG: hypothetical protein COB35_08550 [Gammaproteobacteria bacterium]